MNLEQIIQNNQRRRILKIFVKAAATVLILLLLTTLLSNAGFFDQILNTNTTEDNPDDSSNPTSNSTTTQQLALAQNIEENLVNIDYFLIGSNGSDLLVPNLWLPSFGVKNESGWSIDLLFVKLANFTYERVQTTWTETQVDGIYHTFIDELSATHEKSFVRENIVLQFSFSVLFHNSTGIEATWVQNDSGISAVEILHVNWTSFNEYPRISSFSRILYVNSGFSSFISEMNALVNPSNPFGEVFA